VADPGDSELRTVVAKILAVIFDEAKVVLFWLSRRLAIQTITLPPQKIIEAAIFKTGVGIAEAVLSMMGWANELVLHLKFRL
jgi:hypothetical protein